MIAAIVTAALTWAITPERVYPYEPTLVHRFTVTPAAVPTPRLRHELLPPRREQTLGNAGIDYLRAAVLMPKQPRLDGDAWQKRFEMQRQWGELPLDRLPLEAMKAELKPYDKALKAADRAARATRCDWQPPRPITMGTVVADSEIQPLREVMQWLRYRISVELAEGRFDDAERSLQTAFQMAKHAGEGPSLLHSLVGVAFVAITLDATARWGTAPGSPNLYWALATLPEPLLDLRPVLAGEAEMMANGFPLFTEFERGPVTEARARELVEASRKDLQTLGDAAGWFEKKNPRDGSGLEIFGIALAFVLRKPPTAFEAQVRRLSEDFAAVGRAPSSRKWLRERGVKKSEEMPPLQAAYLAAWLHYLDRFDDVAAASLLPTREAAAEARRVTAITKAAVEEAHNDPVCRSLLVTIPALEIVLQSHIRIRRQLAAVRTVEALRAHLAKSGGKWPDSWNEVQVVPVPNDPLTGQPFGYEVRNGVAIITAPPPEGVPPTRSNNFRYELRTTASRR